MVQVRIAALAAALCLCLLPQPAFADEPAFTSDFALDQCHFSLRSENPFFPLRPGLVRRYTGESDSGEAVELVITVRDATRLVQLPLGGKLRKVRTRIVEEREEVDGELVEISRNFFAVCRPTDDVFYFGEEVDIYEDGAIVSHDGAWLAGQAGALPGVMMPGRFLLGSRYFNEVAPNAMDRAEHAEDGLALSTEAGDFTGCVRVVETTPLEPGAQGDKLYCPGVGLTRDNEVELVEVGKARNGHHHDGNED